MKTKLKKIIKIKPPFDKRSSDPQKNYGISSLKFWMVLKGRHGAVQVMFNTQYYPVSVMKERIMEAGVKNISYDEKDFDVWDVGYHSIKPMYEGQTRTPCDLLREGHCYFDGSSLRGNQLELGERFLESGEEPIWEFLVEEYKSRFGVDDVEVEE